MVAKEKENFKFKSIEIRKKTDLVLHLAPLVWLDKYIYQDVDGRIA